MERQADCLSSKEIRDLISLYEAKGRTLKILEAMGRNPLPMEMLGNELTLEYLKKILASRV